MKLYSKIAYHSTKQKGLKQFEDTTSEDKAFTGEGAQVHGWGLYLQADKELNIERYKESLSDFIPTITLTDKNTGEVSTYHGEPQHGRYDGNEQFYDENDKPVEPLMLSYLDEIVMHGVNDSIDLIKTNIRHAQKDIEIFGTNSEETFDKWSDHDGLLSRMIGPFHVSPDSRPQSEVYFSEDEWSDICDDFKEERYGDRTMKLNEIKTLEGGYDKYSKAFREYLLKRFSKEIEKRDEYYRNVIKERYESSVKELERYEKELELYTKYDYEYSEEYTNTSQYTVEIPDDMIFIDEEEVVPLPDAVIDYIVDERMKESERAFESDKKASIQEVERLKQKISYWERNLANLNNATDDYSDMKAMCEEMIELASNNLKNEEHNASLEFHFDIETERESIRNSDGYYIYHEYLCKYMSPKQASQFLMNNGVDGIKYDGDVDGECYVIFSCDKLKIINEE